MIVVAFKRGLIRISFNQKFCAAKALSKFLHRFLDHRHCERIERARACGVDFLARISQRISICTALLLQIVSSEDMFKYGNRVEGGTALHSLYHIWILSEGQDFTALKW